MMECYEFITQATLRDLCSITLLPYKKIATYENKEK